MLFGRFIHHFPYFGIRNEGDRQQLNAAFSQTQALFKQHFDITLTAADTDASSEDSNDSKKLGFGVNQSENLAFLSLFISQKLPGTSNNNPNLTINCLHIRL